MRKTRVALRAASPASCTRYCGTKPSSHRLRLSNPSRQETASSSRKERSRRRRGCSTRPTTGRPRFQPSPPRTQLTPSSANRARREGRHPKASKAEKSSPLSVAERTAIVSEGRIPDLAWRPCGPRVPRQSGSEGAGRKQSMAPVAALRIHCSGSPALRRPSTMRDISVGTASLGLASLLGTPPFASLPRRELAGFAHERQRPGAKPITLPPLAVVGRRRRLAALKKSLRLI